MSCRMRFTEAMRPEKWPEIGPDKRQDIAGISNIPTGESP